MKWTEGHIHIAMRQYLANSGWSLIAGEYPGGSDHELYPLNVVDRTVARDNSPDARRHSLGELIPDLVAFRDGNLAIIEAKVGYSDADRDKLITLLGGRRADLLAAIEKFATEKNIQEIRPAHQLVLQPVLAFLASREAPVPNEGFSYLRIHDMKKASFEGLLAELAN